MKEKIFLSKANFVINSEIINGELRITWGYSNKQYKKSTVHTLANNYLINLKRIISHCSEQKVTIQTPSDFGLGDHVSYADFDLFIDKLKNSGVENFVNL